MNHRNAGLSSDRGPHLCISMEGPMQEEAEVRKIMQIDGEGQGEGKRNADSSRKKQSDLEFIS